ncbi:MAG: alpha/beta fold hydrolase [Bacteroidota bacterium]
MRIMQNRGTFYYSIQVKFLFACLLPFVLPTISSAQDIGGKWYAKATIDNTDAHYLFDIRKNAETYYGLVDLLSERKFRLDLDSVEFKNDRKVSIVQKGLQLRFEGKYRRKKNEIKGRLYKRGASYKLMLTRNPQAKRNQTISLPLPYESQEVHFFNQDSTRFVGTLTMPKGQNTMSAVVLISGSGPQDRNSEILGHKPFEILADHLSRNGVAVLRYDDRGYGASEGRFRPATSMDYAYDALGAVQFLQNYQTKTFSNIGLIGHSEGGNIAPVVATMSPVVDFLVLLAAPAPSNYESYLVSLDLILKEYPETYDRDFPFFKSVYKDMATIEDKATLKDSLQAKFARIAELMEEEEFIDYGGKENYIKGQVSYHTSDWYHHYLRFDLRPYMMQLDIPILALNGDKDDSVPSKFNLNGIAEACKAAGNQKCKTVELTDVNHFFQVSTDSKIENVYFNEETFSKRALEEITKWLKQL